jgi:3-deoxy-D-manno-octulosonate 8-phosphate phosphatase (KDO 8-P phosphatase)
MADADLIRCLCVDCDGVLTDGRVYVDAEGRASLAFHVHDGLALRWFRELGGSVVLISGKNVAAAAARARELQIEHVLQGSLDKLGDLKALLSRLNLRLEEVAMIGDDLPDLPVMLACGYPIAVANAAPQVKAAARYVTTRPGGAGAVREAIEHLLEASGKWQQVCQHYAQLARGAPAATTDAS